METQEKPTAPETQQTNNTTPNEAVAEMPTPEAQTSATAQPEVDIEAMRRELEEARSKAAEH